MGVEILITTERMWTLPLLTKTGGRFLFRLLAATSVGQFPQIYARGLNLAGWLSYLLEDLPASRQYTAQALQLGQELSDLRLIGDSYYIQSLESFYRKDYIAGQVLAGKALAGYQEAGYEPGIAQALHSLGRCETYLGNSPEARQHIMAGMEIASKMGDIRTRYTMLHVLGEVTALGLERLDSQARDYFLEALQHARDFNDKFTIAHILNWLGEIERDQGQFAKAVPYYEEAIAIETELGRQDARLLKENNLGFVYYRLGKYQQAKTIFTKILGIALKSDHLSGDITSSMLGLATVALAEGRPELSAKILGATDDSKASLEFWKTDRNDYEWTCTNTKALLGEKQYDKLFAEGKAMSQEQAAELVLRHQPKERSAKVTLPSSLTRREIEILRLVAQGLSDAQVAERLVLSPRTVNAHLTSIYNKLGVNSRVAATRYAIEHGLA
jgi:DNA-binding CsgD family transcriptional regulator/tetratricopeptide (TPR) repeat protein